MKDLIEQLQAAERTVATGTVPAGDAKVVTLTRTYPAAPDDVWDALTNPERIPRWFLPVSGDLRLGGRFQFEGQAGGEVRECDPPQRLVVTWEMGPPSDVDSSLVEVRLASADGGTRLTLEHRAAVPPEFWDQYGPGSVGVGWDLALLGLHAHLTGVEMGSPEELERDPAMHAAMTFSSEQWGTAHGAAGATEDVVRSTVAATTAFYVPPPEPAE